MCFSEEASFAATAALLPAGVYCVHQAATKDRRFLLLALAPVAFAVQQASEGFVWYGLRQQEPALVQPSMTIFLFFALAFWPFWVPFSLIFPERRRWAKVVLAIMAAISLIWFADYLRSTLIVGWTLHAHIVDHSIDYGLAKARGAQGWPLFFGQLAYMVFACGPFLFAHIGANELRWRCFAGLVIAAFVVSDVVYWYAFASVWCFFAAVSCLAMAYAFAGLPRRSSCGERLLARGN